MGARQVSPGRPAPAWGLLALLLPVPAEAACPPEAGAPSAPIAELAPGVPLFACLLPFDDERRRLSLDYRRRHEDPKAAGVTIEPRVVTLHHTATRSLEAAWRLFAPSALPARSGLRRGGALNVSAHFLVDRDGAVHALLPTEPGNVHLGRHCIGLNHVAIGVENVAVDAEALTEAQVRANVALVRTLKAAHPGLEWLIGHHEHERMRSTPLWRERQRGYRSVKVDPGPRFMAAVREGVRDLGLRAPP